ncbi:MAG: aminoglycoside phosphotransferase [Legionellales bacterium]|nr:aminoglycoside phosphotransferase [Legionellales bacterium]|tara:strand:- start:10405 stop:11283 length:879 start_codon:yes stop_codon:yes gene_type:complete
MTDPSKHPITDTLVTELIVSQFPQWADLAITPMVPGGWDNKTFRLGDKLLVRLPSAEMYANQVFTEQQWLPTLASQLPLTIPKPIALGKPEFDYPWHWSVYEWIKGTATRQASIADMDDFAKQLSEFLNALQACDTVDAPTAGPDNFYRGGDLSLYDNDTRNAIAAYTPETEAEALLLIWETALASKWQHAPVWIHGDVAIDNLLLTEGKLHAVIDFGCMAIGDPACDLVIAWHLFDDNARQIFRNMLNLDQQTWQRAKGWALWKTLCAPIASTDVNQVINNLIQDNNCGDN